MVDFFGYLFLGSFFALIVGLVKPAAFARMIKNPTRKKVGLIFVGLILISFVGFGLSNNKAEINNASDQTAQKQAVTNKPTAAATQAPVLSEKDQIKNLVTDQLKGQNNMNKDNLKKVEVTEQDGGGWDIAIDFNANDNLTMNLRKVGIEKQMSELYISLYKSGKDIRTTTITAYFPLQDQYGKVNDQAIYQSTLDKEEANKVNWNADDSSLKLSILPKVWTTTLLHPEFK